MKLYKIIKWLPIIKAADDDWILLPTILFSSKFAKKSGSLAFGVGVGVGFLCFRFGLALVLIPVDA